MERIIKNLLVYWKYLGGAFLLILVQLYSFTGMAASLYHVRDTGADKSGIEYTVADVLTFDGWQQAELFMSDSEKAEWNHCYEKGSDGMYYFRDALKNERNLSSLEKQFRVAQAIVWQLSLMETDEVNALLEEYGSPFDTDYMGIRDRLEEQLDQKGNKTMQEYALHFVKEQSELAGVDLKQVKTQYISGSVFRIVFYLILAGVSIFGAFHLLATTAQWIGRRIQEPEVCEAEQFLAYLVYMLFWGVGLYGTAMSSLQKAKAGIGWYLSGIFLLLIVLAIVFLVRTRPSLEPICQKLTWTEQNRKRAILQIKWGILFGIPLLVFAALWTAIATLSCTWMLFLVIADFAFAAGAFLLPEIARLADCVAENFSDTEEEEWW